MNGRNLPIDGARSRTSGIALWLLAALVSLSPASAVAQTEYYNLDANRPLRVEDAVPTERRQLDMQLTPLRGESFLDGSRRLRLDPLLSYGIASLTEVELRLPILFVEPANPNAPAVLGLTSIGLGAMRALNTETSLLPAIAFSGEVLVPTGSLAPTNASYGVKALLTKTLSLARLSLNASYGTYSVSAPSAISPSCRLLPPESPGCGSQPTVPDVPCARVPTGPASIDAIRARDPIGNGVSYSWTCLTAASQPGTTPTLGNRWFAGAALDHAFALSSTLVGADIFAEHLIGLYRLVDWTAEIGVRHQLSPEIVIDAGVSRHFAGTLPSTAFTLGATYAYAIGRR